MEDAFFLMAQIRRGFGNSFLGDYPFYENTWVLWEAGLAWHRVTDCHRGQRLRRQAHRPTASENVGKRGPRVRGCAKRSKQTDDRIATIYIPLVARISLAAVRSPVQLIIRGALRNWMSNPRSR